MSSGSKPPGSPRGVTQIQDAGDGVLSRDEVGKQMTGSRIPWLPYSRRTPLTVVDAQMIQNSGLVTVGQVLQQLTIQANGVNVQFNRGGRGSTRMNLRGIGASRTLVLLNGRRIVPVGLGADMSTDLNLIPIEVVDRIEIAKDGASAVYGSEAIAGVVNIITKRDFSGVGLNGYFGASERGGETVQANLSIGDQLNGASYFLSLQYYRQEDVSAADRSFSRNDLAFNYGNGDATALGSSAPPEGLFIDRSGDGGNAAFQDLIARFGNRPIWFNDPLVGWRPAQLTGNSDTGDGDFYNYASEADLITPSERVSIFAQGSYELAEDVQIYLEGLYGYRRSRQRRAPLALFLDPNLITVSSESTYNPFGRDFADVRRRLVEGGNQTFTQDVHTYRLVAGVKGGLPERWGAFGTWDWDININYGRTNSKDTLNRQYSIGRITNAVGPSFIDVDNTVRCGSPGNVIDDCVPLNLFGGAGSITPEMVNYIGGAGVDRGLSEQLVVNLDAGGEVFKLWGRAAHVALGLQHRYEAGEVRPAAEPEGGSINGSAASVDGSFNATAGYAEVVIPILAGLPAAELLEASASLRVFHFDTFGTDLAYRFGGAYSPYKDISLRGAFARAFRAPSLRELYQETSTGVPNITDPCDASLGRTAIAAFNCGADGIPDNLVTGQSQLPTDFGGNAMLDREIADVITAGLTWAPTFVSFLDGLSVNVDYFNISVENIVQDVGADFILDSCYQRPIGERAFCDRITRNDNFIITSIDASLINIGAFDTSGVDLSVRYQQDTLIGQFGGLFAATWVNEYRATLADGTEISGKDQYDLSNSYGFIPSWRFNATLQWAFEGFGVGWNLRYIRGIRECEDNNCAGIDVPSRNVDANTTMDVFASYTLSTSLGQTSLRAGVNNLTDQTPPTIYSSANANSDPAFYDYMGRFFYVRLGHRL